MGRHIDTGTVDDMRRSVHPKAATAVDDRYLRISVRRNPESSATMLSNAFCAATGRHVSTQTVRNKLHDAQLHSRRRICLQPGQAERLRHTVQREQQGSGSLMFGVALCGADVRH